MHLTPREVDKLVLHGAGVLAQKRLARGLRLNQPEAVALISTQLLELIRDGRTVQLVAFAGGRIVRGGNSLGDGATTRENQARFLAAVASRGFGHAEEKP